MSTQRSPRITVGLIAAPGTAAKLAEPLAAELAEQLGELYPDVEWRVDPVVDGLVALPAATTELIDAAHRRLLGENWELAVCLTDLPLRVGRRTVVGHASPSHRLALVSVPALGAARTRRRALGTALGLIGIVLGRSPDDGRHPRRLRRRLINLDELTGGDPDGPTGLAALVRGGRLRLLGGMVWANRPWRLTARLYRALIAALATITAALVTSDVWRIGADLSAFRLGALTVLSVALTATSLIAAHDLWERGGATRTRDQVLLFNAATSGTVVIGILCLYLALIATALAGAGIVITPDTFSEAIGSDARFGDYVKLAWFVGSLATVAGALGGGLESDEAIREAAYGYRPPADASWSAGGAE